MTGRRRQAPRPFDIPIALILGTGFVYYLVHHIRRGRRAVRADAPPEA